MSSQDRRRIVLNAIIEDYVRTREPVGSKAIVERHRLGVSPATIRNDMAALEEEGLLAQPHTSAGRIPTDAGYRSFVDSLAKIKPLSRAERAAIEKLLTGAVDLDDVLDRTVRLLAQVTRQVAVVQYPSLRKVALRHVELVPVGDRHALLVIITDAGRVEQRTIETESPLSPDDLAAIRASINDHCIGLQLEALPQALNDAVEELAIGIRPVAVQIGDVVAEALRNESEERVVVAGTANLARHGVDFAHTISPVLDVLEEQVVMLRMLASETEGLNVRIGRENEFKGLTEASVVSAGYVGAEHQTIARLGVLGPTRMDYPGTMASVYAIAAYLSDILGAN